MPELQIRQPAVAGSFYPADPSTLERTVASQLADARRADEASSRAQGPQPKALIVPHAGFVYSGPVAASAYVRLAVIADSVTRVVLLGPSHRVYVRGLAASSADAFTTPLGEIPIDREAIRSVLPLPQVSLLDEAHTLEHSLEVQLPFLQLTLGSSWRLVPFSVGQASAVEVAEVLEALWGGAETLILISSDLSHYYDYETARRLDAVTTRAIEALDPDALDSESACGRVGISGLLLAARRHGLGVETVDVRSSGDTAGPRDQVVGYGSYVFG